MIAELIEGKSATRIFEQFGQILYQDYPHYRGTEASIQKLLLGDKSVFNLHIIKKLFLIRVGNQIVARYALICDKNCPDLVQVAFFEAIPGLQGLIKIIKDTIRKHFPTCTGLVVGINGHFNYSAGILMNRFEEPPVFGLPYNPPYYADYFSELNCHRMVSFRFSMETYYKWAAGYQVERLPKGLNLRFMDKTNISLESAIYTQLNNQSFASHPYWTDRTVAEDLELFKPFRFLLDNENLIFAEIDGQPVGFYLWYPDFNQLVNGSRDLNVWDVLKFRLGKRMDTFRFTEIGIIPRYQGSAVALAMTRKSVPVLLEKGYRYCEGGFILEANKASMAFVKGTLKRCEGKEPSPYRIYAFYTSELK